jgi:glycosyltransferase involved in cell wall biosynthesis
MTRVLIDASNLHVGGGVQVAGSFVDELGALIRERDESVTWPAEVCVEVSTEVMAQLSPETVATLRPVRRDRRPTQLRRWLPSRRRFDVSFVVFGPEWGYPRAKRQVVGFADVTAVFPRPSSLLPLKGSLRAEVAVRSHLSRWLHSRAWMLISETEYTAAALSRSLPHVPDIEVVPNTANSIFSTPQRWKPLPALAVPDGHFAICYVARAYDHKNHQVLPQVAAHLRNKYRLDVEFVVTLTDDEWAGLASRDSLVNVGPLAVEQVPALLQACDASILPTLLESFSVTPLEAFAMRRPLFASDLGFIRDSCSDAPFYFDPESPANIADVLGNALTAPEMMMKHVERGSEVLAEHMTPRRRAVRYMQILEKAAGAQK